MLNKILFALCFVLMIEGHLKAMQNENHLEYQKSIFLLKSEKGSGSAFLIELDQKKYLITNNHVILDFPNICVYDINGKKYNYSKVLSHPRRDLALIPIKTCRKNLKFATQIESIPINSKVLAIGDSLGEGVLVQVEGALLGIGPKSIEVNAAIVPGNSGGPIIDVKSGLVIGVSTYCKIINNSKILFGSRFVNDDNFGIRRFGTRIDNIDIKDFELLSIKKLKEDQKIFCKNNKIFNKIKIYLKEKNNLQLQNILKKYTREKNITWNSSYLKKRYNEQVTTIEELKKLEIKNPLFREQSNLIDSENKLMLLWKKYYLFHKFKKIPPTQIDCPICRGTGYFFKDYSTGSTSDLLNYHLYPCRACIKGKITKIPEHEIIKPCKQFIDFIKKNIFVEDQEIFGFKLGASLKKQLVKKTFYSDDKMILEKEYGFGKIIVYRGNHNLINAEETAFFTMDDVLLEIRVLMPPPSGEEIEDFSSYLINKVSKHNKSNFYVYLVKKFPKKTIFPDADLTYYRGKIYVVKPEHSKIKNTQGLSGLNIYALPIKYSSFTNHLYDPKGDFFVYKSISSIFNDYKDVPLYYKDYHLGDRLKHFIKGDDLILLSVRHKLYNKFWEIVLHRKSRFSF